MALLSAGPMSSWLRRQLSEERPGLPARQHTLVMAETAGFFREVFIGVKRVSVNITPNSPLPLLHLFPPYMCYMESPGLLLHRVTREWESMGNAGMKGHLAAVLDSVELFEEQVSKWDDLKEEKSIFSQ